MTLTRPAAAAVLIAAIVSGPALADTYTTLTLPELNVNIGTWTSGGDYEAIFPGTYVWNSVPFVLAEDGANNKAWIGNGANSLDIPVNVYGVTHAYTLINTAFGSYGAINGSVEFIGSGGSDYVVDLQQGVNLRDHYFGFYNNTIDNVHAVLAYNGAGGAHLDMQIFDLPATFADETLLTLRFNHRGDNSIGNPFIAAATVSSVPLPGAVWLLGTALVPLLRRRSAAT